MTCAPPRTQTSDPHQNHLLAALPASDYERLEPHLELIPMKLGEVLYESGSRLPYVYFPYDLDRVAALRDGGRRIG
jgi:hypothetical protein